ncbi:MAG: SDR family oxidoreductase [Candidatus Eremiobacteraeota bacterium]|nr:SDR family oxidoreductase [Candidatus Eremiobacteraeota bacterium]
MSLMNLFSLKGKTAIVTGGAGHLGTAFSEALAEAGANVVIASRNEKKCIELAERLRNEYDITAVGMELDVSSLDSINKCWENVYLKTGSIDILVNNATYGASGSIETLSEDDWAKGIDGTINNVFRCTKAAIPYMKQQKTGVIINISSMYGNVSPDPMIYGDSGFDSPPNYGAGKSAIMQFTRYCACHLADYGIRVNCISPGPFPNPDVQKEGWFIDNLNNKNPLGRIGQPSDLKGIAILLASDASSYITGQNIFIDGGWTIW